MKNEVPMGNKGVDVTNANAEKAGKGEDREQLPPGLMIAVQSA